MNLIKKIIGGLSFTTALFIFQACYGTAQDFGLDLKIEGQVKSKSTGDPIKGIKVSVENSMQYEYTNEEGKFLFYAEIADKMKILFEDIDSSKNGLYINKDTILSDFNDHVYLDILMEEN